MIIAATFPHRNVRDGESENGNAGVTGVDLEIGQMVKPIMMGISYNELGQMKEVTRGNDVTTV